MKNAIINIMGKLTGAELGKLKMKDRIGVLTGITPTYSENDFDIAIDKHDRASKVNFLSYIHLSKELTIICMAYQMSMDSISKRILIINAIKLMACWSESYDLSRQMMTIERIKNHYGDDPGEDEAWLRDVFTMLYDGLVDNKENVSKIYDQLKEAIICYFNHRDLIKGLSERLGLPELEAVISDDTLSDIEILNMWAVGESFESPIKELFQEIDIEELKNKPMFDVKEKIDEIMTWIG